MMMQAKDIEVVRTTQVTAGAPKIGMPIAAWLAAVALLALAVAGAFASQRQLQALLTELDEKALERAAALLERTIEQQKLDLLAESRVLSDDTRVRTTVMTPQFNEATVRDVLEDLRRASGTSVMAVLDVRGKVQAVSGSDSLRGMDLGASPLVSKALDKAVAHVWTFPDQVLVVAISPVRSAGQVAALLLIGHAVGESSLGPIERALGVASAVVIRDKVAALSSRSPEVATAVKASMGLDENRTHLVGVDGAHVVRITGTSESGGSGRVIWVLPRHQQGGSVLTLQILGWLPIVLVGLALALAVSLFHRGVIAASP